MPLDHQGALSGVTYAIPALADVRDPSKAFADFADTLPPFPPVPPIMQVAALTGNLTAAVNHIYISEGAAAITVTLPTTGQPGDKIAIAQVGAGVITISGIGAGTPVTSGANTAVTAVWDGAKWVGLPFSFSGTRPSESTGGTRPPVDLNGFRYHIFDVPGTYTFTSHKQLDVEVYLAGGGADGSAGSVSAAGQAGGGGEVRNLPAKRIGDWTFTPVVVGAPGAESSIGGDAAAGGQLGGTTPATTLTGDWATAVGKALIGGPGGSGPAAPATFGVGGGAGYDLLDPYPQETESYEYTTGGTYDYDCSYGARAYQVQTGTTQHRGDTRPVYCPDGWRPSLVTDAMVQCQNIANPAQVANSGWMGGCPGGWYPCGMNCCTDVPTYETRYACDSGGSLSGTTCVKTCQGNNSQTHTGTRPKACNAGYTAVSGQCVDSRSPAGGRGGGGLVALRYAHP